MSAVEPNPEINYAAVGRLGALGIHEPWQSALYLPATFIDCSRPNLPIRTANTSRTVHRITITSRPQVTLKSGRQPMIRFRIEDSTGRGYKATVFGSPEDWLEHLHEGMVILVELAPKSFLGEVMVTIYRRLPGVWDGRMIPVYPLSTSKIVEQDDLRNRIDTWLPKAIPVAADHIRHQLQDIAPLSALMHAVGAGDWTIEQLLQEAHSPRSPEHADGVIATLQRLAAMASLHSAKRSRPGRDRNSFQLPGLARRIAQLPFKLTDNQSEAVHEIASQIADNPTPIFHVIFGDVGSGKSCCYQLIAAAAAEEGKRTIAMFPTSILAQGQFDSFRATFPDVTATLVTAETSKEADYGAAVIFATSAILHKTILPPDLLVIDEQHKYSTKQRQKLAGRSTHVIEMSATCIPRSQALMRYGQITVSQLRQGHAIKSITTRLWEGRDAAARLFREIKQDVSEGYIVLVVYPKRESSSDKTERSTVSRGTDKWEAQFPGLVRSITSDSSTDEVANALRDIASGAARLLISTTVIEVGVDLPDLRRVVVIDPQRHGLSGLHQLRGRLARQGGEGQFHLLSTTRLPETSRKRVEALIASNDGFEIAEMDLRLRGPGDLRAESRRQAGADGNFLIGQPVGLDIYDAMNLALSQLIEEFGDDPRVWRE